jgi:uncharacterized integral membrane protein (TIGR00698 family)
MSFPDIHFQSLTRTDVASPPFGKLARLAPGILLCAAVSGVAIGLQTVETTLFGRAWLEALVLAILVGTAVRTAWKPHPRWKAGIDFSAKILLEVAVVLLGASISAATLASAGLPLLIGVAVVVALAISASYGLGRLVGLPHRMATLIACGNSICGNSAIAAVAPVIGADADEVATSIAFTAVLGVGVVLGLPVLAVLLHMRPLQFGALAGLTVYAVPQVLAATAPVSALSVQMGTLVKLVRVLMLGPVSVVLALITARRGDNQTAKRGLPPLHHLVPWFIVGFLALTAARSVGVIPTELLKPAANTANVLTVISMAALGLGVDVRVVANAGVRVVGVVVMSLVMLGLVSLVLIRLLGLA